MAEQSYAEFLDRKRRVVSPIGVAAEPGDVHPMLHEWQRRVVAWAVRTGRAALWEDTGLGKTVQQVEWARLSGDRSLIVAPLAVCGQTVREAAKVGVDARYVRSDAEAAGPGVWVTNYEMAERFNPDALDAMVLDESSILKRSDGKMARALIQHFKPTKHRLSCSATPAPNDAEELTNQAEFLGVTSRVEMLAAYFVHDSDGWRLKGYARDPMFRWMASWAVALRRPSDIGGDDAGYDLPGLEIEAHRLPVDEVPEGQLFAVDLGGVGGRAKVRKQTMSARCEKAAELINAEPDEPWVVWCGLNGEARDIARLVPGAVNVEGSWTPEAKADAFLRFADGGIRVMVTKPSIASFGLNWQHCARTVFVGLSDSYEQYYQAIRRCYRYGQTRPVRAHIVVSELESQIAANVARKEREAASTMATLVERMRAAGTWSAA